MGLLVSRFRKKATTKERLEQIELDIERIQSTLNKNREQQRSAALALILFSLIMYFFAVAIFYMFYMPRKWSERMLYFVPFLVFPVLVIGLRKLLHFVFVTRISKNNRELEELKKEKKKILENVMETETYKVAKEILEKYDPNRKLVEKDAALKTSGGSPGQELRKRNVGAPNNGPRHPSQQMAPNTAPPRAMAPRMIGNGSNIRSPAGAPLMQNGQQFATPNMRGPAPAFHGPMSPAAPILPRDRSFVDKIAEYFVGDGPNNRYALICKQCFSHNGMALAEEFMFTSFKCCYCGFFNPARKQRPNAPRLEQPTPSLSRQQSTSDGKCDDGGESDKEGSNSGNDNTGTEGEDDSIQSASTKDIEENVETHSIDQTVKGVKNEEGISKEEESNIDT